MTKNEWAPEEFEHLRRIMFQTIVEGRTKTEAFRQFARENGLRTENAARYKWITAGTSLDNGEQTEKVAATTLSPLSQQASLYDTVEAGSFGNCLIELAQEYSKLRDSEQRLKRELERVKKENKHLRAENEHFARAFHLAGQHLTPPQNNFVVRIGRDGLVESVLADVSG